MAISTKSKPYLLIAQELRQRMATGVLAPQQQLASQNELAVEFGVSPATVQKSLKELEREGLIRSEQGKGRFVKAPAEPERTHAIGVVLFSLDHLVHPVIAQRLAGILEVLQPEGYHMLTYAINRQGKRHGTGGGQWLPSFEDLGIDGAIVIAQEVHSTTVQELAADVPCIWMDAPTIGPFLGNVSLDYLGGGFAAAQHLLSLRHRRLIMLGPSYSHYRIVREQYNGARLAVDQFSDAELVFADCSSYSETDAAAAMAEQLDQDQPPTAVICVSDEIARGAWMAISERGLRVPEDLSLIGWNDTLTSADIPLPLTTIKLDFKQAGTLSATSLLAMLDEGIEGKEHRLDAKLIIRRSTTEPIGRTGV